MPRGAEKLNDLTRHDDSYWQLDERFIALRNQRLPRPLRALGFVFVGLFALAAAILIFTPWVQTTAGYGEVTAIDPSKRQHELHTLVAGRIDEWFVRDGDRVSKGDPIVRILDNDPLLIERLNAEMEALEAQREAARLASTTAQRDYERKKSLRDQGLSSERDVELARIRVQERRAAESEIEAQQARASVSLAQRTQQTVVAPSDGTIIQTAAADTATWVSRGATIASFLPHNDQPAVTPGRKVRLEFDGWPTVQFSGWPSIAIGTFGGVISIVEATARPDGTFRVFVVPDPSQGSWPNEQFVRFGARTRGWVQLDTVPLGYELWRLLNQFPPNYVAPDSAGLAEPLAKSNISGTK